MKKDLMECLTKKPFQGRMMNRWRVVGVLLLLLLVVVVVVMALSSIGLEYRIDNDTDVSNVEIQPPTTTTTIRRRRLLSVMDVPPLVSVSFTEFDNPRCDVDRLNGFFLDNSQEECHVKHVEYPTLYYTNNGSKDKDEVEGMQRLFRERLTKHLKVRNENPHDLPKLVRRRQQQQGGGNQRFAIWDCRHDYCHASAWDDTSYFQPTEGGGDAKNPWSQPDLVQKHRPADRVVRGTHVAFTAWFEGNFGHYFDDHLPSIAYLKSQVPPDTRFLLQDRPLSRNVLRFLDPLFYHQRIEWIQEDEIVEIQDGDLLVSQAAAMPLFFGCCRPYDFLRHWIHQQHPLVPPNEQRRVVFYSRASSDTGHGRVLDATQEQQAIAMVKKAMVQYQLPPQTELLVFTGQNSQGETLAVEEQFAIFRSARTIVGPHGAGLMGNLAWIDPLPRSCERRVQLLEFIPGPHSTAVQPLFHSVYLRWRVWPVEIHNILYTKESSGLHTYIDLNDLRQALHGMWGQSSSSRKKTRAAVTQSH